MNSSNTIRLSIIIPCFNDGQFIKEAVASVTACPDSIYEIIIVNDGSTDLLTQQVLNELRSDGYQVVDQPNQGAPAARNTGVRLAKGEYILPLDADNRIRTAYIYKGIEILDRYPDVAVVYGDVEHFGEGIHALDQLPAFSNPYETVSFENGFRAVQRVPDFNLSWLINHNYIDMCAVYRKSVWDECGPYDINMPFGCYDDWDLWLSIAKKGYRFYHIPEILFEYRVKPTSLSTASRSEEKSKVVHSYLASKHAALFPKEYRSYFKLYRGWLKIWNSLQPSSNLS
ncbi:MAG TPA: glycosyltransferase [Leptolyngbyaceae cyanobacterium M33_DOE_097]|uniref:Glycosyltransferase n=1 Tax=Oscillatoriales cyanobacterium SpSt-418 TaxID=2282169 RepID=A0A7C3KGQ8_9CYAN|nr:glycosyltransferase [Leptolyngbyaceae cyanobacterium M33_DOE_097]